MKRMEFDSQGRLLSVDNKVVDYSAVNYNPRGEKAKIKLQTSDSLSFLREGEREMGNIFEKNFWSLHQNGSFLKPLMFSNGKTQEDVVKEICDLVKQGTKVIFLKGACGTGKSAIALNLARVLGRASIIVPVKALQNQYEKDYTDGKYLIKLSGERMKIAMLTGRENHDSIIKPGVSCADPFLPDTIKITDKNYSQIQEYYESNPLIRNKSNINIERLTRIAIAPANPYWSPIISAEFGIANLTDAKKYDYLGCDGKKYIFYHRKEGCSYYDQYLAYKKADVIIFNSAKYVSELSFGRKPLTEIDIVDEADVFLDNFFEQAELNLSWLSNSLRNLNVDSISAAKSIDKIRELIELEEKNKKALGIDESQIFKIEETKIKQILQILNSDSELQSEIAIDELNYANKALEAARDFSESLQEAYVNYRKEDDNLFIKLVSANLSYKINDLLSKTKALVFMSGTLHSKEVLEHIFQIKDYKVVEAETLSPGSMEIIRTGGEFDCKYSNFQSGKHSRKDYLSVLSNCVSKAPDPTLIQVHAFQDLPSEEEKVKFEVNNLISREELISRQKRDRFGKEIEDFKRGKIHKLFSSRCSRGVDFPGDVCRAVVFTKYPNPNIKDIFWKVIQNTHPDYYWEFYKDKAKRDFIQRIYRAIRSKDDHVYVLSPDIRVLQEVKNLQNGAGK